MEPVGRAVPMESIDMFSSSLPPLLSTEAMFVDVFASSTARGGEGEWGKWRGNEIDASFSVGKSFPILPGLALLTPQRPCIACLLVEEPHCAVF